MKSFFKIIALSSLISGLYGFASGMDRHVESSLPTGASHDVYEWDGQSYAESVRHDYPKLHTFLAATPEGADWINDTAEKSGNIVCLYHSMRKKTDALEGQSVLPKDQSFEIVFSAMQYLTRVALDSLLIDLTISNPVRTQSDAYSFLKDKTANYFLTEKRRKHIQATVKLDEVLEAVHSWFNKTLKLRNLHNPIWTLTVGWDDSWFNMCNPWVRAIKYGQDDPDLLKTYHHNLIKCLHSAQHPVELRMKIIEKYLELFKGKTLKDVLAFNLTKEIRDQWRNEIYDDLSLADAESDLEFEENEETGLRIKASIDFESQRQGSIAIASEGMRRVTLQEVQDSALHHNSELAEAQDDEDSESE